MITLPKPTRQVVPRPTREVVPRQSWASSSAASCSQASARRAVDRIATTVADSSALRRDESRSPAQVRSS